MPCIAPDEIDVDEAKPVLRELLQAGSRLYMHFARETLAAFWERGGMTIRQHLREYGTWRGSEMREAHNALGLPINMETLNRCWDSASVFIIKGDIESKGRYTPYDVIYQVNDCPAADVWRAEEFHRWGHVYGDEFHQACASTYHPDGNVVIPINMMKGDDHCAFRWVMPADARVIEPTSPSPLGERLAAYYRAETPGHAVHNALVRTSRLFGGRYWTMARALYELHPEERAEAVLRRFLQSWAEQRGRLCRERRLQRGKPLTKPHLLAGLDLAPDYVWDFAVDDTSDGEATITIDWTPMDEAWRDLEAGPLADLFWQESLPAFMGAYQPGTHIAVRNAATRTTA
jgi:hypothetical protein